MVKGFGRRGQQIVGMRFSTRERISDEDSGYGQRFSRGSKRDSFKGHDIDIIRSICGIRHEY